MPLCPHAYLFTSVCVRQHIRTEALFSFLCLVTSFMCSLQNAMIMFKINGCSLALTECGRGKGTSSRKASLRGDSSYCFLPGVYFV